MARSVTLHVIVTVLLVGSAASAALLPPTVRETLRDHVMNFYHELDLMIRNQRADLSDIRHQIRELENLGIYRRIPLRPELSGLRKDVDESARVRMLRIVGFRAYRDLRPVKPVPSTVFADQPPFQLNADQIAEVLRFRMEVEGSRGNVQAWVRGWRRNVTRLVEPFPSTMKPYRARETGESGWIIEGRAFCFRPIRFPKIVLRDPVNLLPLKYRENARAFAKAEPEIWRFVERSRRLVRQAAPLYEKRREYLLNRARFDFYSGHAFGR